MVLIRIFLTLCFLFFSFTLSLAEQTLTFDLGEIVVTKDKDAAFGNASTTELTSEEIEARSAQTVEEALDFIPGVRLTLGQKNEPYVMIRGFNQDKILILLDGIPIASPYYGYVDLNQIPVESISKIKVVKGYTSALYGANTIGGVINIISKKPTDKPRLELTNGFSDHAIRQHILSYAVKSKDVSLWFSASHRQSDGFRLSRKFKEQRNENGGYRENSYYEKDALSLKLGLERYENHNPSLLFNYIDNEKGIPPHTSSSNPRYWQFTEWKRWMFALADEFTITDSFSVKGRIFYDKYDNTIKSYDDSTYSTQTQDYSWTSIYDEYSIGSSIYLNFNPSDLHSLKGAINFKKDVHKEQGDTGDPWETYEIHTYSLGLEDNISLNQKLALSIGASFDLFDQIKSYTGQEGDNIDSLNPGFMINYSLDARTSIYSSISRKTRFPAMNQLYSSTSGNPNLKEQRNINYEAGIKHDFDQTATIELSYFYNDVEDLIDRASRNDPYLNISQAVFEGVEASIKTKFGEYLSGRLSYTYLDARDKDPELFGRDEQEISYVPAHKTDLELKYLTDLGLSCSVLGSYHGQRYYYDSSNAQHALGGYFVWNAKVSYKLLKNWQANLFIENLFDRNYQEEEGYPQPGRTLFFNIKGIF